MNKRLALFVHHDGKGELRNYVRYCIAGLQSADCDVLVVVNGDLLEEGEKWLAASGAAVLFRENKGFDFWGWKAGLEYAGPDRIREYDEILLTNNTFYGPIYPFAEMFDAMAERNCDFWGINRHPLNADAKMPEHLQSYWLVFRKRLLESEAWRSWWDNLPPHHIWNDMVYLGEIRMTRYLEDRGFTSASYMDFDKYTRLLKMTNPCFVTDTQVIEDRCPIAKRKFFWDWKEHEFNTTTDYRPRRLLNFLAETRLLDPAMIYDDLIRFVPMSRLNDNLHFVNILPSALSRPGKSDSKTALVVYVYPLELVDYCFSYVKSAPEYVDIVIVTASEEVRDRCAEVFGELSNSVEYRIQPNRGRDNSALLVTCADIIQKYDYIGFVHAKRSPYWGDGVVGNDFRDHCFNSLLFSGDYIKNVISLLDKNPHIGLLVPFEWNCGYMAVYGNEWAGLNKKETAAAILKKYYGIEAKVEDHPLSPIGGMLWFRSKAVKTLTSYPWGYDDFPEEPLPRNSGLLTHHLERLWSFFAQKDGYYTSYIAPDSYAAYYINDSRYFKREITAIRGNGSDLSNIAYFKEVNAFYRAYMRKRLPWFFRKTRGFFRTLKKEGPLFTAGLLVKKCRRRIRNKYKGVSADAGTPQGE